MIRNFLSRIGCLMLFFGIIVLVVGVATAQSRETPLNLYLIGSAVTVTGFILYARMRSRSSQNKRSSFFRKRERRPAQTEDHPWENQFYD